MDETLDRVADWARERIRAGQEHPWSFYKLMQLIDAVEGLKAPDPSMLQTADLPEPERPRGMGGPRLVCPAGL